LDRWALCSHGGRESKLGNSGEIHTRARKTRRGVEAARVVLDILQLAAGSFIKCFLYELRELIIMISEYFLPGLLFIFILFATGFAFY
jgi:hypothetical protein